MGIVSHCPNGHRLKVKDHLAGKKGICPTCGARFRIPLATTTAAPASPAASGPPVASVVSLDAARAATLPPALVLAESTPPPAAIAEAPAASWCIAVPGGQRRFMPLNASLTWLRMKWAWTGLRSAKKT
jgi:hypothetical protein